jgi:hypothetical protein
MLFSFSFPPFTKRTSNLLASSESLDSKIKRRIQVLYSCPPPSTSDGKPDSKEIESLVPEQV